MRRSLALLLIVGVAAGVFWMRTTGPTPSSTVAPASIACRWATDQVFAFDVAVDTELTFDETALVPGRPPAGSPTHTEAATAAGRLDAKVLSVAPGGVAIVAARLADWSTNATGADAFPAIDADMRAPYLLRIDARCHVVATARRVSASIIAYRRALGVFDRLDFTLPPPGTNAPAVYASRQLDDFGSYTIENRYVPGDGRGEIERRRLAYDAQQPSRDAMPMRIKIRSAGGSVDLGTSPWFSELSDHEDVDVISNGAVPLRTRSTSRFTGRPGNSAAFDDVTLAMADFTWGRPTDAELQAAHDALRGSELVGLSASDAVDRFTALRDGGTPGAWHDAQRLLRDWMRANPAGVESLAQLMLEGRYARKDQADFVLAMAKSRSPVARRQLTRLTEETAANTDLRVQAASACGDLTEPSLETVDALERIASAPRTDTPDDILPSTALMSIGTIVETAPGTPAAARALAILQRSLQTGGAGAAEALYAASNSGDPSFLQPSVLFAASTEPDERAAAAHAMRKMLPSEVTADVLDALMHEDTNPEVVKQVAEARRQQLQTFGGGLSTQELALYATKLPTAPEGVRWELVRTLGQAAPLQPAATTVLVEWYRSEPVNALKMLIGQYVPASALRG
ncbi:MAG TPA: hypothetical protein VGR62_26330 [Candidatus Binatia bacterium]|jgi:hypothetical protein|nr:hypothetical protein [Candidatus Binatia bacterium]